MAGEPVPAPVDGTANSAFKMKGLGKMGRGASSGVSVGSGGVGTRVVQDGIWTITYHDVARSYFRRGSRRHLANNSSSAALKDVLSEEGGWFWRYIIRKILVATDWDWKYKWESQLPLLGKFARDLVRIGGWRILLLFASRSVQSMLPAASLYYSREMIEIAKGVVDGHQPLSYFRLLKTLFLKLLCELSSLQILALTFENNGIVKHKLNTFIQSRLIASRSRLDLTSLSSSATRQILHSSARLSADVYRSGPGIVMDLWQDLVSFGAQLAIVRKMVSEKSWPLVLASLGGTVYQVWRSIWGRWANETYTINDPHYLRMNLMKNIATSDSYSRSIIALGLGDYLHDEFEREAAELGDVSIDSPYARNMSWMVSLYPKLSQTVTYAIWTIIASRMATGSSREALSMGELLFIQQSVAIIVSTLFRLPNHFWRMDRMMADVEALYRSLEIERDIPEPEHPQEYGRQTRKMEGGKEARGMGIEFRDVSFEYPSPAVKKAIQQGRVAYQMPKVLRNISFTILPGELVALVGFNGSGKSSLVNVISRLYDVTSGTILINGSPIGSYSTPALQKRMSILFQTTTPLPLTAKEYIGVGSVEDVHDMEKIREAARKSDALEIIERLPYGFDSLMSRTMGMGEVEEVVEEEGLPGAVMIGSGSQRREAPKLAMVKEEKEKDDERKDAGAKMDGVREEETGKERRKVAERETDTRKEENTERAEEKKEDEKKKEMRKEADLQEAWKEMGNVTLSGGQQQRIALSQAFMRADADLRVFDEPAGNLDPQAEDRFFKQIYEMRGTCTIIFATHRFSLTAKADRILVMERGQLIEQGTHSELMELKGKYHHLYELQAAGFRES